MPPCSHRPRRETASPTPVPGGTRNRQCLTGLLHAHQRTELVQSGHDHFSVLGISGSGRPNSLATFLRNSTRFRDFDESEPKSSGAPLKVFYSPTPVAFLIVPRAGISICQAETA